MTSRARHAFQRGLTLLEMLVVLLIAGMAIALGFQALGQWRRTNTVISSIGGATQQATLTESWLESSLRSLVPLQEDPFEGARDRLHGVALQAVQSHQGGATAVDWTIQADRGQYQLLLKEGAGELALPLPGATAATFGYLDKDGRAYEQWPPRQGLHDHLPAVIVLQQTLDDGSRRIWASAIAGSHNPRFNPFQPDLDD